MAENLSLKRVQKLSKLMMTVVEEFSNEGSMNLFEKRFAT
jgi:hypothetical protein